MQDPWGYISPYNVMINTNMIEPRDYQVNISRTIYKGGNVLVILPTGLGKTLIAIISSAKALYENKKVIVLSPTKPLSTQHYNTFKQMMNLADGSIILLTGGTHAKERNALASNAKIIIATPQTIANDIKNNRISLDDCSLVVFDECHKAVGKYAYTYIANESKLRGVQILGLTASPGSSAKKIKDLVSALSINEIEIRTTTDFDVAKYVMDKSTEVVYVDKNEPILKIEYILKPLIDEHIGKLYSMGLSPFKRYENMPKRMLLEIGDKIGKIQSESYKFNAINHYVYLINLTHAYDLLTTEGITPFLDYIKTLKEREKKSRALERVLENKSLNDSVKIAEEALSKGIEHTKMLRCVNLLNSTLKGKNAIIFAQYRSTVTTLAELLNKNGVSSRAFMGKKFGVNQASQHKILEDFRSGLFNVLVATSIGEEGLDIPSVDAVVFYEPIASEIRSIQRKGRAGRLKIGYVIILVARGTKDEAYLMISNTREKRMRDIVMKIKSTLNNRTSNLKESSKGQLKLA